MNFLSSLMSGTASTAYDLRQLYFLLLAVLPVFTQVSQQIFEEYETSDNERNPSNVVSSEEEFYFDFYLKATNLFALMKTYDPLEILQGRPEDEATLGRILTQILNELEYHFLSRQERKSSTKIVGIQTRNWSGNYPKLSALREEIPQDIVGGCDVMARAVDVSDDVLVGHYNGIIRLASKDMTRRKNFLSNLANAFKMIDDLANDLNSSPDLASSCPERFSDYPLKHVRHLTHTLVETVRKNWSCTCLLHDSLDGRKVRMNLTEHQRFDIAPARGESISSGQVQFRVLFPARHRQWQDTEIAVFNNFSQDIECTTVEEICVLIQDTNNNPQTYPRMVISGQVLWMRRSARQLYPNLPSQMNDTDFESLENLLQTSRGPAGRPGALADAKDRLILSFVLTTFLLHCVGRPWLGEYFNREKICFSVKDLEHRNITKPYFTANSLAVIEPSMANLFKPHRFPDILSLGILLLEIATGASIESEGSMDRCYPAFDRMEQWRTERRESSLPTVPKGLFDAISACLDTEYLTEHGLHKKEVKDFTIRNYIFNRILYPLGDALCTTHDIQLGRLSEEMDRNRETNLARSFDHEHGVQPEQVEYAKEWRRHWAKAYDMFSECQKKYKKYFTNPIDTYVKVAVLDTGLQLGKAFHEIFLDEGRINSNQSRDFVGISQGEAQHGWEKDDDGHGSRIGRIILDVAPGTVLHIAKVFENKNDLSDPKKAPQVYSRIAEAIKYATEKWEVDIIVMSFGFNQPIPLIQEAMENAGKLIKPPLFFAATRNEAAHSTMAWPASDRSVIGISSTAGNGIVSAFNPSAGSRDSILYAFGEGVQVKIADPCRPGEIIHKYVSGTSYATAVAAGLAANLLVCVRMIVATSSHADQEKYGGLPASLQRMNGMLEVLKCRMQGRDVHNRGSLLPWHFLNPGKLRDNEILMEVKQTLDKQCICSRCS